MNVTRLLMQVLLSLFNFLYFLFLAHLGVTYCRPQGNYMGLHLSITYRCPQVHPLLIFPLLTSCFSIPGPSEVNGLSHPQVIACFSDPSLYLYMSDEFTFPDPHISLFPLNLVGGWPKSQIILPWPTTRYRLGVTSR